MWDQLTPADIERAKARVAATRRETLARHTEELKRLELEEAEIETIEHLIATFSKRYMSVPSDSGAAVAVENGRPTEANQPAAETQRDGAARPQIQQEVSPNLASPVRRFLRG
ncbi:MAG: hypothetical protein JO266_20520 [Acidobacteria bacterium]|nr:hypothetical protein [Acidobacteriota bacterium]